MMLFNLLHCIGMKNMDDKFFDEWSCEDVIRRCCHRQTWHVWRRTQRLYVPHPWWCVRWYRYICIQRWQMCLCNKPDVCAFVWCLLCVPVEMWMIIAVCEQSDATPPMYPSPKMGRMHEQEMKSLNLVVGNGIRKHWPFAGSFRPQCESHDSRIFTVPPVTGLVKSQHTSLKPSRP